MLLDPILAAFDVLAAREPERALVVSPSRLATVAEIARQAGALADQLREHAHVRGRLVGLVAPNGPGFLAGFLARLHGGADPAAAHGFMVEAKLEGAWKPLYAFDLQPQVLEDYVMPNWYLSTHPESHFLDRVVAARVRPDRRYALRNGDLATHFPTGTTERRRLSSGVEIRQTLEELFDIRVPEGVDVDAALERVVS